AAWPQRDLRIFVGCYANDPDTAEAVRRGAGGDARVKVVVHERHGPTTKADCLNTLYAALERDEQHCGYHARMVVLHDAEDMVDPAALAVFDRALEHAEFILLPVLPEVQASSRWVGSHYCDEFAEPNCALSQLVFGRQAERRVLAARFTTSSMWRITSRSTPRLAADGVTTMRATSFRRRGAARARVAGAARSSAGVPSGAAYFRARPGG